VKSTGGLFGVRTGMEAMLTAPGHPDSENRCHGSSRSIAQLVHYGNERAKVHLAFGTDAAGFVQLVAPRFAGGPNMPDGKPAACPSGGSADLLQASHRPSAFDTQGLAHVGLLPDLVRDLKSLGANTASIERSAELYIKAWERTYDGSRRALTDAEYERL
jgi:hypothetical protein